MNNPQRRLRTIEVNLTPLEVVLLWMKSVLPGRYGGTALQTPPPRLAIANSVAGIVRTALKGEPSAVTESAILQARREADCLYNTVIEVNEQIQDQFFERRREYVFLLAYLSAAMGCPHPPVSEGQLRIVTLLFLEQVLLLDRAVRRISTEHFGGHPILFSDSVEMLEEQMEWANVALGAFNSLARGMQFRPLNKDEVTENLASGIDQKVAAILFVARGSMLAAFGEAGDLLAHFNQYVATCESVPVEEQK